MADDKKNISDDSKVDKPPKVESAKAVPAVQDQPAPAGKEAPQNKDAPATSKESTLPCKDEKQTKIPGMGDLAPAGKVVDFTAARDEATNGKLPEKAATPDKSKQADKAKDAAKPRRGRPPKANKAAPDKAKPRPWDNGTKCPKVVAEYALCDCPQWPDKVLFPRLLQGFLGLVREGGISFPACPGFAGIAHTFWKGDYPWRSMRIM